MGDLCCCSPGGVYLLNDVLVASMPSLILAYTSQTNLMVSKLTKTQERPGDLGGGA